MSIQSKCLPHTQVGAPLISLPIPTLISPPLLSHTNALTEGVHWVPWGPSSLSLKPCFKTPTPETGVRREGCDPLPKHLWDFWGPLNLKATYLKTSFKKNDVGGKNQSEYTMLRNFLWVSQLGEVPPLGLGGQGTLVLLDRTLVCVYWWEVTRADARAGKKHWMNEGNLSMSPGMSTQCGEAPGLRF